MTELKIFKVDFKWEPSGLASSIVKAEKKEETKEIVIKELELDDEEVAKIESITEVSPKKGIIYTGYYCC